MTLVACIADDCMVQRFLPQVIVGASSIIPAPWGLAQQYRSDNLYVLRRKHGWVNGALMMSLLKLVGASLRVFSDTHFFILSLDAAPAHMTAATARACHRARMMPHLLPARATAVMQPLDTSVFANLKRRIAQEYEAACLATETGTVPHPKTLDIFCNVAKEVLTEADHRSAFLKCGLGKKQQHLGGSFLRCLELEHFPKVSAELPSLEQLQQVYAKNKDIPVLALFGPLMQLAGLTALDMCEDEDSCAPAPASPPLRERLRSSGRRHGEGSQEASPAAVAFATGPPSGAATSASAAPPATRREIPRGVRLWPSGVPLGVHVARRRRLAVFVVFM